MPSPQHHAAAPAASPDPAAALAPPPFLRRHAFALGLAAILAVGAFLRLWQLGDPPFGFHTDEGHYAMDAWRIVEGARPIYLERNNGREPLFVYLMAGLFALLGPSIASARLTAALAGLAAVAAQALWVRRLPLARPNRVALLSAAFLALGFWPVAQGRYGLRTSLMALPIALLLWAWPRALPNPSETREEAGRPWWRGPDAAALAAGFFLALGAYTYLTGRLLPLIPLASAAWAFRMGVRRQVGRSLLLCLGLAGLLCLPLAHYFVSHPELFNHRTDQVSILSPAVNEGRPVAALVENGWRLAQMPILRGDSSWYHNIKRRPVFSEPPAALAFLAGLAVLAAMLLGRRGAAARASALLVCVAGLVGLLPSWLSEGAPNYVRLTGLWPSLYLLPALGLDALAGRLETGRWDGRGGGTTAGSGSGSRAGAEGGGRGRAAGGGHRHGGSTSAAHRRQGEVAGGRRRGRSLGTALIALTLSGTAVATARDYFLDYAPRPEVYTAFNGAAVERGQALAQQPRPLYVSPALARQSVIQFLNLGAGIDGSPDLGQGLILPPKPWAAGARYAFDPAEADAADAFAERWPAARRSDFPTTRPAAEGQTPNLIVFGFDEAALNGLEAGLEARPAVFGDLLRLERVGLAGRYEAAGQVLRLRLLWRLARPHPLDHNFFVHLIAADGRSAAQFDGPPLGLPEGGSSHASNTWRPGEAVLQDITLTLAADAAPGEARLLHGWYDWRSGARLPVPGSPDGTVELGRIQIAPPPGAGAGG